MMLSTLSTHPRLTRTATLLATLVCLSACLLSARADSPRNVIFMIGDGMGVAQVTAARTVKGKLAMEQLPVGGLLVTHDRSHYVTDSAGGGTALATGTTTRRGMVGMLPGGQVLTNLMETAHAAGKAFGVVTTDQLIGATPSAFLAHAKARGETQNLARQIAKSPANVLIGGGAQHFTKDPIPQRLQQRGAVVRTWEDLKAHREGPVTALLGDGVLPWQHERAYTLADMATVALNLLKDEPGGFVVMIEGALIDKQGHKQNSEAVIQETIDFDGAVHTCLQFLKTHPDTLLVVTADHETGGTSLLTGSIPDRTAKLTFTTGSHSGVMVPLFAIGPGADQLGGIRTQAEVGRLLHDLVRTARMPQ